eukprot:gnl/TRDRNA2_/TRDRNA2_41305_c0_seq1.p1 gnl/TRDRNA2_/TRDRNA2_41305_c0~~gnl/TRDRNA2_/TRDRNA2_41305_c0_seq1.p1  ORF type:complete len:168 (+),score=46.51 gnl/TRDRNA2_/TRDRNA2_41305_c0_seq1:67-570(+)
MLEPCEPSEQTVRLEAYDHRGMLKLHEEVLQIDPVMGPIVYFPNGKVGHMTYNAGGIANAPGKEGVPSSVKPCKSGKRLWTELTSSEREVLTIIAAKKNRAMREWKGEHFWQKGLEDRKKQVLAATDAREKRKEALRAAEAKAKAAAEAEAALQAAAEELGDDLTFF